MNSNCYNMDCPWRSNENSNPYYCAYFACPQRDSGDCIVIITDHTTPLEEQK